MCVRSIEPHAASIIQRRRRERADTGHGYARIVHLSIRIKPPRGTTFHQLSMPPLSLSL